MRTIPDFDINSKIPGNWYDGRVVWIDNERVALPVQRGVEIWNLRAGKREGQITEASDFRHLSAVAASPDGKFLLCHEERAPKSVVHYRGVLFETWNWRRYRNYENCAPLAWSADSSKFSARAQNADGHENGTLIFSSQSATPLQKSPLNSNDFNLLG